MIDNSVNSNKKSSLQFQINDWINSLILTALLFFQIIFTIFRYTQAPSSVIQWIGWILLWSTAVFGLLPIWTFKKYGKVPNQESYIKTTILVDRGIYSYMRHPQYFGWFLLTYGLTALNQHWISLIISLISTPLIYGDIIKEDKRLISKFGDEYREYMNRVPRINFILGFIRKFTK